MALGIPTLDGEAKWKRGETVPTNVKIIDFVDKCGETAYVLMYGNVLKTPTTLIRPSLRD